MIALPDVTVVLIDTAAHTLSRMALEDTLKRITPSEVLIWSDNFLIAMGLMEGYDYGRSIPCPITTAQIPKITCMDDYNRILWCAAPGKVQTSHMLVMQWDGWVLDESRWDDRWLGYDYIGAPWRWHGEGREDYNVGNGGFSLRSVELMRAATDLFELGALEDDLLCRKHRRSLEGQGFVWAPIDIAARFSFEHGATDFATFGYHDVRNWHRVLAEEQLDARIAAATTYIASKNEFQMALGIRDHRRALLNTLKGISP